MTTVRILALPTPSGLVPTPITFAPTGQSYSLVPGTIYDLPAHIADFLKVNGFAVLGTSGPTSSRPTTSSPFPTTAVVGSVHVDMTLGYSVVWDGTAWRNPANGNSV